MNLEEVTTLVKALQANQQGLGLSWTLRPGTVDRVADGITYVRLDGSTDEDEPNAAVPLGPEVGQNLRVMCLVTSPTSIFVVSSNPGIGSPVLRLRRVAVQSIANGGSGTYIEWDTLDLDVYGVINIGQTPTEWIPPVAGWYLVGGRAVFSSNATSRRGFFINRNFNETTDFAVCGSSLQAPATGTAQIGGYGIVYMNGQDDYIGARALQNSGAALDLSATDNGSVLEATYMGGPLE